EVAIGGTLSVKGRTKLCSLLKENLDIFAWQPTDMTGVPRSVAEHRLNIQEGYSLVRQKKMGQASERIKAIQAEDCYPLPEIDWKVESLCGYPFKCLLDAYKGYHQIQMAESDEEKMVFHTSQRVYCYTKMPFGLKNAGATYQRLVDKAFDSQILADFLVKKPDEAPPDTSVVEIPQKPWTLFTDGSSCVDGSGAGLILTSPEGTEFTYALRFQFTASNNEAEYEALIAGLRIAAQIGVRNVNVSVDSKLVANQVLGTYIAKEENMVKYLEKAKSLISGFANFSICQVPSSKNKKADALSKIVSTSFTHLSKQVLVKVLKEKSIQEEEVDTVVEEEGPTWMTQYRILKMGLPEDRKEAR
ncbi:reverse transcriptase domain-containing protein, partial [Tanacetum coccineum]